MHKTKEVQETAVLVGLITQKQSPDLVQEYLDELKFLATTLNIKTVKVFTQRVDQAHKSTFIKAGKLAEVETYVEENDIDLIIFDDDLSSSQVRNLEAVFKEKKVLDRSLLILQIFMARAKTAQAKTQVELAHYQYMLPRLTRMWTHLSRQKGGIGMRGGAGEKELETDRRLVRDKIALLRKQLVKIEKQSTLRRKNRGRKVRVALVGYTNVGKSTLMRLLTKADVFAEDKLFATVDSTVRKVFWEGIPFLMTDTVGFIRKLPTTLVESFKSTLVEIVEADVLLHVVDVSHPTFEEHIKVVKETLKEIGAGDKKTILVFNKIDNYKHETIVGDDFLVCPPTIEELKATYMRDEHDAIFVSAIKKENIQELKNRLIREVAQKHYQIYPNTELLQYWLDKDKEEQSPI